MDQFLNFNKIRILTDDLQALAKAIKRSTFLELNEEHTKVKRCVPYVQPNQADVDKRTVYVVRFIHFIQLSSKNLDFLNYKK